jgi:hypothetical protein
MRLLPGAGQLDGDSVTLAARTIAEELKTFKLAALAAPASKGAVTG